MPAPRRTLRRYEGLNHARYLTCSCYRRLPLFRNDKIKDAFVKHLALVQQQMEFELFAWVVMPEHVHLMLRPKFVLHTSPSGMKCGTPGTGSAVKNEQRVPHIVPQGNVCGSAATLQTVTQILRRLKRPFSTQVLERWRTIDASILQQILDRNGKPHFWQQGGGYDRNIFKDEELVEKINYIHNNPAQRGLGDRPEDYPWSSAKYFDDSASYDGPTITRWL
jgi:putative transposase